MAETQEETLLMLRWANPTHSFTRALVQEKSKLAFFLSLTPNAPVSAQN